MNQAITIDHLQQMPVGEIAALPAVVLARLQKEADEAMAQMKQLHELLNGMIARRFGDRATVIRREANKDFGLVRFREEGVEVIADLKKEVKWDQPKLAAIATRIAESGENPCEYIKLTHGIDERKYSSWPSHIKAVFEDARTVQCGRQTFRLEIASDLARQG